MFAWIGFVVPMGLTAVEITLSQCRDGWCTWFPSLCTECVPPAFDPGDGGGGGAFL